MQPLNLDAPAAQLWPQLIEVGNEAWLAHTEILLIRDSPPDLNQFEHNLAQLTNRELHIGEDRQTPFTKFPESFINDGGCLLLRVYGITALCYCLLWHDTEPTRLSTEVGLWLPDWVPKLAGTSGVDVRTTSPHPDWPKALAFLRTFRAAGAFERAFIAPEGQFPGL